MLTKDRPPSRNSIFATGEVKCRGPHHRLTSSGSVQTFQTNSTGALNVLVTSICFAIFNRFTKTEYLLCWLWFTGAFNGKHWRPITFLNFLSLQAFSNASISNFPIFINACTTRGPFSGSDISWPNTVGTTCQDNPNLSLHHPHLLSCPPSAMSRYQ